jgi:hypothetical protein
MHDMLRLARECTSREFILDEIEMSTDMNIPSS